VRIAQAPMRTETGALEETGGAGCPEHIAPLQGAGRSGSLGVSIGVRASSSDASTADPSTGRGWA
jgi:hypothetical protein